MLLSIIFIEIGYCQEQKLQKNIKKEIQKAIGMLEKGKLEGSINLLRECIDEKHQSIFILSIDEKLKSKIGFERFSLRIDTIPDLNNYNMFRIIKSDTLSVYNTLKLFFKFPSTNFHEQSIALAPGLLVFARLKEDSTNQLYSIINYYNLSRFSKFLVCFRFFSIATAALFGFYALRRFYIDENNYKHYLNAPTLYDANRLKQKCKDGRKITNYAGAITIASGLLFGYFFTKDIFWPWVSGKEQLLALDIPNKNPLSHVQILPQLGCQKATINISYRF